MDDVLIFPKDAIIYQGLKDKNPIGYWFTDDIGYASIYTGILSKNKFESPCIKMFKTNKYLRLLNVEKVKLSNLSNKKDIVISSDDKSISITLSLRDIYKIMFGRGCNKLPQIKTEKDIEDLINLDDKFKDTQYFYIYIITKILGYEDTFIRRLRAIIKMRNRREILKKNEFNRISKYCIDIIFVENLKKKYPNMDGYYAPNIQNDYQFSKPYGDFFQKSEIALFNNKDLKFINLISKTKQTYYACMAHNKCD